MTNPDHDSLISRMRKLAAMTTERGASEAEAMRAAELLARMMAEHNIARDELSIRQDAQGCITEHFILMTTSYAEWRGLPSAIAQLFECRAFYETAFEDPLDLGMPQAITKVNFYGFPADVAGATALMAICVMSVNVEAINWKPQGRRSQAKLLSFRLGMIQRLAERIRELVPPTPTSTGTALVVLKDQLVSQQYAKDHPNMGHARGPAIPRDQAAYAAGQAAGDRVGLARGQLKQSQLRLR